MPPPLIFSGYAIDPPPINYVILLIQLYTIICNFVITIICNFVNTIISRLRQIEVLENEVDQVGNMADNLVSAMQPSLRERF